MSYRKIHAYIRSYRLDQVEDALGTVGVGGYSYCRVRGSGEYVNYFSPHHLAEHLRLEIFVPVDQVDDVVGAIVKAACTAGEGDGLVAVLPVERVVRIRDGSELSAPPQRPARPRDDAGDMTA